MKCFFLFFRFIRLREAEFTLIENDLLCLITKKKLNVGKIAPLSTQIQNQRPYIKSYMKKTVYNVHCLYFTADSHRSSKKKCIWTKLPRFSVGIMIC